MSFTYDQHLGGWIDLDTGQFSPSDPNPGSYSNLSPQAATQEQGIQGLFTNLASDPNYVMTPEQFQNFYQTPYTNQDLASLSSGLDAQRQQAIAANEMQATYGGLVPIAMFAAPALASAAGLGAGEAAAGADFLGAGVDPVVAADAAAGTSMFGGEAAAPFLGAGVDPVVGADAAAGTPMYGAEAPFMGAGVDPVVGADAASGTPMYEFGPGLPTLPSIPSGVTSAAQQLAKALTGGSNIGGALSSGIQGFMQGATPTTQGYVRKARPPLTQPAFLGDQGQQALGSAEDSAFNQMVSDRGDDVSTRARQMASQLRGRPGMFGFRSG